MWKKSDKLDENQKHFLNQSVVYLATIYHYDGVARFNISTAEKDIFKKTLKVRLKILKEIEKGQPQLKDVIMADIESFGQIKIGNLTIKDTSTLLSLYEDAISMTTEERTSLIAKLADTISKISKSSPLELDAEEFRELCIGFYIIFIGKPDYSKNSYFQNTDYIEALDTLVSAFKTYCDITDFNERYLTIWVGNKLKIYNKYGTFGRD